jgi:hypothetical protein
VTRWSATPDYRTQALRDSLVAFWIVLWLTVGVLTGAQIWSLSEVSRAVDASATATDQAGEALQELSELPLVPEGPGRLGDEVRAAAEEIRTSAATIRADVRQLSVLVGLGIALVPTVPVVALYLPGRLRWQRTVDEVRRELDRAGRTPELDAFLAHRAVTDLSYRELTALTPDPVGDLVGNRHDALATEQLRRLGLAPARQGRAGG